MRFIFIVVLIGVLQKAYSQENTKLLRYYDSSAVTTSMSMFGGISLSHQGQSSSSMFGVSAPIKDLLCSYPSSKEHYGNYKTANLVGNVFIWGGLAVSIAALEHSRDANSFNKGIKADELYLLSSLSILVGAFVIQTATKELLKSVEKYNREKIKEYPQ